jgi:hypothetical protein
MEFDYLAVFNSLAFPMTIIRFDHNGAVTLSFHPLYQSILADPVGARTFNQRGSRFSGAAWGPTVRWGTIRDPFDLVLE